ncbi:rho GTPase-activating protein 18-like isoform X1 [Mercenaria mercenaria]|uniref:rho GTPase-activating protein 18-like isoform X1 n=1 Tax=Mercenaria mercenaria TaxID=6596 RepID=UPI00234F14D3|nr:rho GTPase-activating protein 18-like isoform X1 [Mercenaria mercenaria]XP_053382101.1 rho GTPase-activating protein 18-like isoform X1 [Mercenaria mercenaria]XP_053382102.1 rho GTPase-activating protein 18-like isoform X1 [Mercenaria mercenaria]
MARSQSPGDLRDYFQEFEDIKSSKRHDEEEEESAKTPDEGEQEAAWLQEAGYGFIVSKFQAGTEFTDDEINKFTESMPSNHAAVVKRRVDTLNATLRKKQKYSTKIDVRNIFPEQPASGKIVIHSQPLEDEDTGTRQLAKRPATLPRGMKLGSYNGDSSLWTRQRNKNHLGLKYTHPSQSQWKNTSPEYFHSQSQWKNTSVEYVQGQSQWKITNPDVRKSHISDVKSNIQYADSVQVESSHSSKGGFQYSVTENEGCQEIPVNYIYFKRSDSKDSVSPLNSPQRSRSSSCDTLDSLDSGLESSESILNPEHSSSHDSLDTVDSFSCFPRKVQFRQKLVMSPAGSPGSSYSPIIETASPVESPIAEGEATATLVSYRKRQNSVTEAPKSPLSPRGEVVHPEWNRNRASKGPFMKNKGGYSMSGMSEEVQDNVQQGVEMLSVQQKGTVQKRWSQLSPISDADIVFDFNIEENGGESMHSSKTVMGQVNAFDLPNFSLVPDKLGLTCVDDINETDAAYVKNLALLELTSMFDTHNINYSRRRTKKRHKEHGIFGVPLVTLLEQDQKLKPNARIPLVFQEIVSYLVKFCLDTEGILRVPGSTSRIKQLRQEFEERFYQGTFIWADDLTPNDVAALLKQFLRDLPVPLLTDDYIEAFAQVENLPDKKQQLHALNLLILLLPTVHRDTLSVLLELLEKVIELKDINKMSLNNVAMIMAPNLFMAPKVRGSNAAKNKVVWDVEIKMAANTSNIMKMLIRYRNILWTVPTYLMSLVRRQYELETIRKNKDKSKMKGLLSKKDKTEVYKKPALKHEADFHDGVIRIQAPNLTKSSTAIQLDNNMTAGDIVSKFKVIQGSEASNDMNRNTGVQNSHHGPIYNDPRNYQSAGDDTFLFEVGGNVGERCLPHDTNMLALYKVNPNAEWIIKQRQRFKVT